MSVWTYAVILLAILFSAEVMFRPTYHVHTQGVVLITGASSGIGLDAARALAAAGYTVFGTYRSEKDVETIKNFGAIPLQLDVSNETSIQAGVDVVLDYCNSHSLPLVALVNNAGISLSMPIELFPLDRARTLFDINLFGVLSITQACLPRLRQDKGRIVNIGSVAGLISLPGHGIYSATKFALEAVTDALRLEVLRYGVAVVMVEPGYVQTNIMGKGLADDSPFRHATPEQQAIYPHFFKEFERSRRNAFNGAAFPNTTTTPAILDAITSTTPSTRYVVADVGRNTPAWLGVLFARVTPTSIRDKIMYKGFHCSTVVEGDISRKECD